MTLREHLDAILRALPPEASVTLPVTTLEHWLDEDDSAAGAAAAASESIGADLTVERVAECLGVGLSRARDIIRENHEALGAYRRGRRWYVPTAGLQAWQRGQAAAYRRRCSMGSVDTRVGDREVDFDALRREL